MRTTANALVISISPVVTMSVIFIDNLNSVFVNTAVDNRIRHFSVFPVNNLIIQIFRNSRKFQIVRLPS